MHMVPIGKSKGRWHSDGFSVAQLLGLATQKAGLLVVDADHVRDESSAPGNGTLWGLR